MMKWLSALSLLTLLPQNSSPVDMTPVKTIGVQHGERVKPFDTFARELIRYLSGKENFKGYTDTKTGERVQVFPTDDPLYNALMLAASPAGWSEKPFIQVQNPDLKKTYGLDPDRTYFSISELDKVIDAVRKDIMKDRNDEQKKESPLTRATREIFGRYSQAKGMLDETLLTIIPVPYGKNETWISPPQLDAYLSNRSSGPESVLIARALDKYSRARLEGIQGLYQAMLDGARKGDNELFRKQASDLGARLRDLNPELYPPDRQVGVELRYNELTPLKLASRIYLVAFLLFLLSYAFSSDILRWVGLLATAGALAMHGYGMYMRGVIAGRVPFSNMYESMTLLAGGGVVVAVILELIYRPRVVGLAGSLMGWLLLTLNDAIAGFDPFVSPLVPALKSYWMQIHVPTIMTGYAMGVLLLILGHIYLFTWFFKPTAESLVNLDKIMYRVLQLAALFLLGGTILGAVWAGEAWGRYWGWDMKETWALISTLSFLAVLHGRMTGKVRGVGTSLCSIPCFMILFLTYYGVNFMFGKGLHTYGFGEKTAYTWLFAGLGFEAALFAVGLVLALLRRKSGPLPEPPAEAPVE